MFKLPDNVGDLLQFDQTTLTVATRESKHREFKRDFVASDFSEYTKALASFSNADGGVLIFGVSDKPRMLTGVTQIPDEAQWANRLREDFDPEIVVSTRVYVTKGSQLLVVGVDQSPNRPVICRKSRSKAVTDKDGKVKDIEVLREGSIYFRYAGQTRMIGYAELSAMLADRERKRIQAVMQTLKVIERVGLENTGVVNINEQTSNLYSRETAKGLTFIDEGKFVEKDGAPAYVVLGQVDLNRVVHVPLEEADKNLPTEAASQLKPLIEQVYGRGSTISAQQVSALLKALKISEDNIHCVYEKKFRRKYVTRAGIKTVGDFIREKPSEAIQAFGSKAAIQKYEQKIAEKK